MTPLRFALAMFLFHAIVVFVAWRTARLWRDEALCGLPGRIWLRRLARSVGGLSVLTYLTAVGVAVAANLGDAERLHLGAISGRLMAQALFGEAVVLTAGLSFLHARAGQRVRGAALATLAVALLAVYVDAYHIEPRRLLVRHHTVDRAPAAPTASTLRILHVTDIQTPTIGAHEERALRAGLAYAPDLIVLTGDYVQNERGRPTEHQAARDLRTLMARIGFYAPLGVFATDGDAGPQCREVFAGTPVTCLVDAGTAVTLRDGSRLVITGLSRSRGRERDPTWLGWLLSQRPQGDHRLVISHAPDFVDALPVPVDLVLAGHTHGGQVVLPLLGPPVTAMRLPRRYAGGLNDYRGIPLHVSRGVGMERAFTPPVRFLCPPEACILDVRLPARRPAPVSAS